jgi:hypothetical protein
LREDRPRSFSSGPDPKRGQIDPDSPFAVLAALRDKT